MAGIDRILDPLTGDYVLDSSTGAWETTWSARTAVYHAILCHRGAWAADADFGSRLHTLARAKNTQRMRAVITDMITEALQPLIDAGRISEPVVLTERTVERIIVEATVTDLQTREEIDLTSLLPFTV
jgi:phage gp46-like protein